MGEKNETYGYTYWGHVHEADYPVRFSSHQVIDDIKDKGRKIVAESQEVREGKKGEYLQLTKVKLDTGQPSLKEQWDNRSGSEGETPKVSEVTASQTPQKPVVAATKSTHTNNAYLKDVSNIPQFIWSKLLDHWDVRSLTKDAAEAANFWEAVQYHSEELLRMIDHVRGVDDMTDPFPNEER